MFDNLTGRLSEVVRELRGQARITDDNIASTLREVRMALLEADVALPVVKEFIDHVRNKALGTDIKASLTPGQQLIKIVHNELIQLMGGEKNSLVLNQQAPIVILLAGLQGAGKTTTVAKLGKWLHQHNKYSVMTASCDVYRPAAIEQLKILADENELEFYPSEASQDPVVIAKNALSEARRKFIDILILDSAGRLHIDEEMMSEIGKIHTVLNPANTLFVVDSMMGQDAVNAAKVFNDTLPLTGVVLTKTDGDARGGAALSVLQVTGKPILYMGTGEKSTDISEFHPDRVASRILGMGDMLSLIEEVEKKADHEKNRKLERKIKKGKGFDMEDLKEQLIQMNNMGGIAGLMDKLPGMPGIPEGVAGQIQNKQLEHLVAMINSMTLQERRFPAIINGSRKKRIAAGSGSQVQDVNSLLKQFKMMQKVMKKMGKKGGLAKMMRGMGGNIPPGLR